MILDNCEYNFNPETLNKTVDLTKIKDSSNVKLGGFLIKEFVIKNK